ncbi:solute carrier family 43 member 3-like [Thalassophryne amazonica]|uniref:solute carrier family 43 member 3-like n=1 Tax=Thalassophryne amazonica TaxID=390379 RepID=UPI001470D391|nr:solute carrier family 43 member 3-like [Thalassophryne amazonica]
MSECQRRKTNVQQWVTLLSAFLEILLFTGFLLCWASLVFVYKVNGYFSGHCTNITTKNHSVYVDCRGQDNDFSKVLLVATFLNSACYFPSGFVFDHCGTMVTRIIAISLYTCGTLIVILSNKETSVLLYPAEVFLGLAGSMFFMTNIQVGNLFYTHHSTIIGIYEGLQTTSAGIFVIIKLLQEAGVSVHSSFIFLSVCSIIPIIRTLFLLPSGHIPYPLPETYTYGIRCPIQRGGREERSEQKNPENGRVHNKNMEKGIKLVALPCEQDGAQTQHEPKEKEVTFRSCVFSGLFMFTLMWYSIVYFCQWLYLCTLNPMLTRLAKGDKKLVSHYTNVFAVIQMSGILFAPAVGLIMDRNKNRPLAAGETRQESDIRSSIICLFLSALQCFLFCMCFTIPVLHLQYLTFFLQTINNCFMFVTEQSFIAVVFPMTHYGKLTGLISLVTTVLLLLQFPILHIINFQLHNDPLYVNVVITAVSLLTFIQPIYVSLHCKKLASQRKDRC